MQKKITRLEHPRNAHMVGDGFRVSQYIPGYGRDMNPETSPFLMLDYNAPWHIPPQKDGYRPGVGFHPHRGFETVTIVYSGEIEHQDTAGNGGIIGADEVQWMTAGSGLLHNEFMTENFSRNGGTQHAVQLWVDLPKEHKMTAPRYQALTRDIIPEVLFSSGKVRVIAGQLNMKDVGGASIEKTGGANTFSPIELYDIRFEKSGSVELEFSPSQNVMILMVEGDAEIAGKELKNGDMAYFSLEGSKISLQTHSIAKILVMGGKPLGQSVVNYGPFVMTSEDEIVQAWQDFQNGKMGILHT
ncbi:MAG: pirin family protein [Candidatus Altimarinota bacterium]